MKKLDITMTIKAENYDKAELLGKMDLMEFAKIVGQRSMSSIASCSAETTYIGDDTYEIVAEMHIDGNVNVNEVIKEAQSRWKLKSRILSSNIFVSEEKHEEAPKPATVVCENCGQIMVKGSENVINPETTNEYYLCDDCLDVALDNEVVVRCECCDTYVSEDELIENPVTESYTLCPNCGANIG